LIPHIRLHPLVVIGYPYLSFGPFEVDVLTASTPHLLGGATSSSSFAALPDAVMSFQKYNVKSRR
jgi:hypothetical protein